MFKYDKDSFGNYVKKEGSNRKFYYTDDKTKKLSEINATEDSKVVDNIRISDINLERTIFFFDVFDTYSSEIMIEELLRVDSESNEDINILINSCGGSVSCLFSILDTIAGLKSNVNTICLGEADSCGALLLAAGNKRYIGENSRTMIHEGSSGTRGKISEIERDVEEFKKINDKLASRLSVDTKQNKDFLVNILKNDTYLDSKQTVAFGIADAILLKTEEDVKDFSENLITCSSKEIVDRVLFNVLHKKQNIKNRKKENTNNTEGEPMEMKKSELLAKLKSEFELDVESIQAKNNEMASQITKVTAEKGVIEKELKDFRKEVEDNSKKELLEGLIKNGKSTQEGNKAHKAVMDVFNLEQFKKYCEELPVIMKDETISNTNAGHGEVNDKTSANDEHNKILAELKKRNLPVTDVNYDMVAFELI